MKFLQLVIAIIVIAVIWGYWDSSRVVELEGVPVTADLIDAFALNFDTMPSMEPFNRGQLFVRVRWQQPEGARIAEIYVSGAVLENGQKFTAFGKKCQRAGSTWLAEARWEYNGYVGTDLACFIKLDKEFPVGLDANGQNSLIDINANNLRRVQMNFDGLYARTYATKVPYRYVTWINDRIRNAKEWVLYPFERI